MADHYKTVVMHAPKVGSPKDKPIVEGAVGVISTWIIAMVRNTHCFSFDELNVQYVNTAIKMSHSCQIFEPLRPTREPLPDGSGMRLTNLLYHGVLSLKYRHQ